MPRLFVALRPPDDVAEALAAQAAAVEGARWLAPHHLHVTLTFLGHVPSAEAVADALAGVEPLAAHVSLERRAAYPGPSRARVLVAEGPPDPGLAELQRRVEAALSAFRAGEARPFRPHVTLARLKSADPAAVRAWLAGPSPPLAFAARELLLYESRLGPEGAAYVPVAAYPLVSP